MPWVAPVVAALASAGTAIFQSVHNKKLQALNNQANVELWNKQNEYNSPKAQMQRYRDAGLNEHLVHTSPGLASAPPTMQAPQDSYASGVSSSLDRLANLQNLILGWQAQKANIENLRAQIGLNQAKTETEREKLQDWRFKNLFGLSNYQMKSYLMNLKWSDLYNKYSLDWTPDSLLDYDKGTIRVLRPSEIAKSMRSRQLESSLNYQNAGTSLRNIQADWQASQNAYGLPANAPWFLSVGRKLYEYTEKKRKNWLRYH